MEKGWDGGAAFRKCIFSENEEEKDQKKKEELWSENLSQNLLSTHLGVFLTFKSSSNATFSSVIITNNVHLF